MSSSAISVSDAPSELSLTFRIRNHLCSDCIKLEPFLSRKRRHFFFIFLHPPISPTLVEDYHNDILGISFLTPPRPKKGLIKAKKKKGVFFFGLSIDEIVFCVNSGAISTYYMPFQSLKINVLDQALP
jgi:hypothetical protein